MKAAKPIRANKLGSYHIWIDGKPIKGLFYIDKRSAQKSAWRLRTKYGYKAVVRKDT